MAPPGVRLMRLALIMLLAVLLALCAVVCDAAGGDADAAAAVAVALAERPGVGGVSGEGDFLGSPPPAEIPEPEPGKDGPLTYEEAREESLRTSKPLVAWVGTDVICPGCIAGNPDEFVHFIAASHPGFPTGSLTVGVVSNGELKMAGQVTAWPDGHMSTIRSILRQWDSQPLDRRRTVRSVTPAGTPQWHPGQEPEGANMAGGGVVGSGVAQGIDIPILQALPPAMFAPPPVMMMRPQPMMRAAPRMMFGGRACAT